MTTATGIAALVAVWVVPAILAAFLARKKGRSFVGFLALGLLLNGLLAIVIVLLVKDRSHPEALDPFDRIKQLEDLRDAGKLSAEQFESETRHAMAELDSSLA